MKKIKDHTTNDINSIIENKSIVPEVENLSKALKEYVALREIDNVQDKFQLILVIAAILDWSEEEFEQLFNHMNRVFLKRHIGVDIDKIDKIIDQALDKVCGNKGKVTH